MLRPDDDLGNGSKHVVVWCNIELCVTVYTFLFVFVNGTLSDLLLMPTSSHRIKHFNKSRQKKSQNVFPLSILPFAHASPSKIAAVTHFKQTFHIFHYSRKYWHSVYCVFSHADTWVTVQTDTGLTYAQKTSKLHSSSERKKNPCKRTSGSFRLKRPALSH